MFTGLVSELGVISGFERDGQGARLEVATALARELGEGDSVAVNGVCLTATRVTRNGFRADVIPETLRRTTLAGLRAGGRVNLERPLTPRSELGGHFVQGHVDGVARVLALRKGGGEVQLAVELPHTLRGLLVEKGSIAIDGVSLTVVGVSRGRFHVSLIPHTLQETSLGDLKRGSRVNLEADILAKHVRALLRAGRR